MYERLFGEILSDLGKISPSEDKLKFLFEKKERYLGDTGYDAEKFLKKLDNKIEEIKTFAALNTRSQSHINTENQLSPTPPSETERQKHNKYLHSQLTNHNFFPYILEVKQFSENGANQIWTTITENKKPYIIALLYELGFIDYLKKEYCDGESNKRDKLLGKILDANPRNIRGNINTLSGDTEENKDHYTAHKHKDDVNIFLRNLN